MVLYELKLKIKSPFMTPWQSDILFGHMAWSYRERFGEEALSEWLEDFADLPPFVLSDGLIEGSFPRPMIPPPEAKIHTKTEKIEQIQKGKRLKNVRYVSEEDFLPFLEGKEMTFQHQVKGAYEDIVRTHNVISRESNTSLANDGLFEEKSTVLKGHNRLSIFVRVKDKQILEEVCDLMEYISYTGYGKKKNLGYGHFELVNVVKRNDLEQHTDKANAVILLSHSVPKKDDPIEGWYKLATKYGRVGARLKIKGSYIKKPFTRIMPGSVFRTSNPKGVYGRMINNIVPGNETIVQFCYSLALPVKLPAYLERE